MQPMAAQPNHLPTKTITTPPTAAPAIIPTELLLPATGGDGDVGGGGGTTLTSLAGAGGDGSGNGGAASESVRA